MARNALDKIIQADKLFSEIHYQCIRLIILLSLITTCWSKIGCLINTCFSWAIESLENWTFEFHSIVQARAVTGILLVSCYLWLQQTVYGSHEAILRIVPLQDILP